MANGIKYHRKVKEYWVAEGPRGGLLVRRLLECGHESDKRFFPADRESYSKRGDPFRPARYAWCSECTE